jgi:hypothetical protein
MEKAKAQVVVSVGHPLVPLTLPALGSAMPKFNVRPALMTTLRVARSTCYAHDERGMLV